MLQLQTANQEPGIAPPQVDCQLPTANCRLPTKSEIISPKILSIFLLFAACLLVYPTWAQWGPDVRLTNDPSNSWTSIYNAWCVAANEELVHVVWYDEREGNAEIYYKRSADAGLTWGPDTRLTQDDGASSFPSIATSGSLVLVAWDDDRSGNEEIYVKRSIDGGINWEENRRLTNAAGMSLRPSVAISGSAVHVVWHDVRDDNWNIYYKRSDDGGVTWGEDKLLSGNSTWAVSPSIAVSGSAVHIAWRDYDNNDIYYKCSSDEGLTWGEDIRLTNDPDAQDRPSIAASGSVIHVVWRDFRNGNYEIYYKRSPNGGISWEEDTRLTNASGDSQSPSITVSGPVVHVVWYDNRDDDLEIYYKRSDNDGINWSTDVRLTNCKGDSQDPTIAFSGSVLHVVWTDLRDGNYEIYYKRNQNLAYQKNLYYACKVWGFVKYFHSRVSVCEVNWDSVLVSTLPSIKSSVTNDDFNAALATMLNTAGPMAIATTPSPDTLPPELKRNLNFTWFNDPVFRDDVKLMLDSIKNNFRPHSLCWVKPGGSTGGYLRFPFDNPMIDTNAYNYYPSESGRLLILFKYWNIINYFNPYNYVMDNPWDSTLYQYVLKIASAVDYLDFYKIIEEITTSLNDAHVELMTRSNAYSLYGYYSPKLILSSASDNYMVVKTDYMGPSKGDILISVDGQTPDQLEAKLRPYISAGNESIFRKFMCQRMLLGDYGSQVGITYKDSSNNIHTITTQRNFVTADPWFLGYYPNDTLGTTKWKKWNCNVGYVNMGNLETSDIDSLYNTLKTTAIIIFDIRNYPKGTGGDISNIMYPERKCYSKIAFPDIHYPGTYYYYNQYLGSSGNNNYYPGKVVILCNQQTISQAEYTCMMLDAMPDAVIIGSQTAGTDGTITYFNLTREMITGFTALGMYYPDGECTQRIGIVPDSIVYITPAGIRQGRDEVLEKALQVAGCLEPMFSVTPLIQEVPASVGTTAFTVTSNTNWSAISNAEWCTVTSSGSGNGNIKADYEENSTQETRTASIRIIIAGMPDQNVSVNQAKSLIGIEKNQDKIITIYPNPTKGKFRITSTMEENRIKEISVQHITGRIILLQQGSGDKEYILDLSSVPEGCYFIIIKTSDKTLVHKLIIN